jgi:AcrR family transcriptional regulator
MNAPRQAAVNDPRANQKERTRAALLDAASELLRNGVTPTVADAAEAAKVSRATAYRYFPTQDYLLLELSHLRSALKPVDALLADLPGDDVEQRLRALLATFNRIVIDEEVPMRTWLRASIDTWLDNRQKGVDASVREGRRIGWLDQVLEPVRRDLSKAHYQRLRAALALTLSIEPILVMKDVCRLDDKASLDVLEWAATALLRAGLEPSQSRTTARRGPTKAR